MQICWHSFPVRAYFRRSRRMMVTGRHSRSLCGPADGRGAQTPAIFPRFQWEGALRRFWCFLGPRGLQMRNDNIRLLLWQEFFYKYLLPCFPSSDLLASRHSTFSFTRLLHPIHSVNLSTIILLFIPMHYSFYFPLHSNLHFTRLLFDTMKKQTRELR